ncbi:MAG: hypothetical protein Kow0027_20690 [Saprospiraceae bacterium]
MRNLLLFLSLFSSSIALSQSPDTLWQYWHKNHGLSASDSLSLVKLQVFDNDMRSLQGVRVCLREEGIGTLRCGLSGTKGEVFFLLPRASEHRVDAGDEPGIRSIKLPDAPNLRSIYSITVTPTLFSEIVSNDTIVQAIDPQQQPTTARVLAKITVVNLDREPLAAEQLFFRARRTGFVYRCATDEKGRAVLMLPKDDTYCLSTIVHDSLHCFDLPAGKMKGTMRLSFRTIGTEEFLRRKKERERLAAERDSLYRLERARDSLRLLADSLPVGLIEEDFMLGLSLGAKPEQIVKNIERRAEAEKELLEKDPQYYEKSGEEIKAAFFRNRNRWANKVIVTDLTGSMKPYMDQVLVWQALQRSQKLDDRYLFFNDGDAAADNYEALGQAGGLHFTEGDELEEVLLKMRETVLAGFGGSSPENDLEALLAGAASLNPGDELVLIADNYSDVWDIELLKNLNVPVHIILAGTRYGVNEQYLEIAWKTGGSVHTLTQDIEELKKLAEGDTIEIGAYRYRMSNGKFLKISGT